MTTHFSDGPDGNDPLRPKCTCGGVNNHETYCEMWQHETAQPVNSEMDNHLRPLMNKTIIIKEHETEEEVKAFGVIVKSVSQVKENVEKDSDYCPYCLRCPGLVRMEKVEPLLWKCRCGAVHDERNRAMKK